jgi:hypothetical protein
MTPKPFRVTKKDSNSLGGVMKKVVALVLTGALALGAATAANADESIQKEEFTISPTKLDKKKPGNIEFVNTITTPDNEALGQPPSATRTVLDFPKQFKLNYKKYPTCEGDANGLGGAVTAEDARAVCGKKSQISIDSGSFAVIRTNLPAPFDVVDVDVIGFNEDGGQLLLWSKPQGDASAIPASILQGKVGKTSAVNLSRPSGPYKQSLDVAIPTLTAGAIAVFEVQTKKSNYIQAKCKPSKMVAQATTVFSNGGGADGSQASQSSDTHEVKCKAKKKKKK